MCGRARCSFTRRQALQCAQASRWVSGEEQYEPRQNASPGHWLPVIVYEGEGKERVLKGLRWGMGRDKESDPFKAFNARAETCEEKPMFKHHLKQHRSVPLSAIQAFLSFLSLADKEKGRMK